MVDRLMRACILAGLIALPLGVAAAAPAEGDLNTTDFIAACAGDPVVTDEPAFEDGGKVTPQAYCECVAGKLKESKLSQTDIDMLVKMHKDEITDEDAESYPTLEDLMQKNESLEDACKESLGMPVGADDEEEEGPPMNEEEIPQDE